MSNVFPVEYRLPILADRFSSAVHCLSWCSAAMPSLICCCSCWTLSVLGTCSPDARRAAPGVGARVLGGTGTEGLPTPRGGKQTWCGSPESRGALIDVGGAGRPFG